MPAQMDQWEQIFRREGKIFLEPAPAVVGFAALLQECRASSVLDLGCGTGRHIVLMAKRSLHTVGMDNAPTALSLARQWLAEDRLQADLVLSDMCQPLPFSTGAFDAVISTQVIHHAPLRNVIDTAMEIQRIVCSGGYILISVPARKAIEEDAPALNEIEPNTFVPTSGSEKGLPHHLFAPDEFLGIFPEFDVLDLRVIDERIIALTAQKR